jgi:hypothetical protein
MFPHLQALRQSNRAEVLQTFLRRRPTPHAAFMMNRLINGSSGEVKAKYLTLLRGASHRTDIDGSSMEAIANFTKLHTE